MKFNFLPREDSFFQQFSEQAMLGQQAGALLLNLLEDFDNFDKHLNALNEIERQGDHIVHATSLKIAKSFVTPIDREDIHELCAYLDDIMDYIQSSAVKMATFQVTKPTEPALQLAVKIKEITAVLKQAVDKLINMEDISDFRKHIKQLEKEADAIHRTAVADLFKHEKDAIELIKWKEIYKSLETVTDKCEDVMDILEGIIIKYA